jgi:hypothetical protein
LEKQQIQIGALAIPVLAQRLPNAQFTRNPPVGTTDSFKR